MAFVLDIPDIPSIPDAPTMCIVVPKGFQALLMAVGLIRKLASEHPKVLVCTELAHLKHLSRLFAGLNVTFWFDVEDPVTRAREKGFDILILPPDPQGMYAAANLPTSHMHSDWHAQRHLAKETQLVNEVVNRFGPSFVLLWPGDDPSRIHPKLLPQGIPVVDGTALGVDDPFDLCGLIECAMQVHAVDGWFLTLADLVGGNSRKFCHAYAGGTSAPACRKRYRRRVNIICRSRVR